MSNITCSQVNFNDARSRSRPSRPEADGKQAPDDAGSPPERAARLIEGQYSSGSSTVVWDRSPVVKIQIVSPAPVV